MSSNLNFTTEPLVSCNLPGLREMRQNGQAPLRTAIRESTNEQNYCNSFNFNRALSTVQNFFQSLVKPNTYLDKVSILANKSWRFINANWDIIALGVSLVALACLINPIISGSVVAFTKQFFLGFTAGFTVSHFFKEQTNSCFERISSMNPILQATAATITTTLLSPIAPFIGGLIVGNHTYKHLS